MQQAIILLDKLRLRRQKLVTAESCTGGLLASAITGVAGASDVFDRGFVTYSNEAKTAMLGVSSKILANFGAVSEEVAREMAEGALKNSAAQIAVSITGIAGPAGGSAAKPIGLVYIGISRYSDIVQTSITTRITKFHFSGNREDVRKQAVEKALELPFSLL